jgi:class 3 adenylate cyclase/tetratricopeptide (TPR) repeat protein
VKVPAAGETLCSVCDERLPAAARFCPACGSPQVAAAVVEMRKTVTLLFCDVTGSTALGERLDPEALREVMSRYFAAAREAVQRHGGTVEKFVGDAVLAVFGIPELREDDALRAVRAAAELRDSLTDLSHELMGSMGIQLSVRTGVNTGSVVAGSSRAGGSFATGDAVNTAARLEQGAASGEILIGASTLWLVRDAVEVEAIAPLTAKGKAEPLPAYRLLRVLDSERGRNRRPDAALVGRESESRVLADALARMTEGVVGQLVTVLGPAGMGKTRLVEHFLAGIDRDVQVLRGRCVSYGHGITFWPLVQVLRQAAGLIGEEAGEATEKAFLALMDTSPDKEAVVARLLPLLGFAGEPGGADETFWAVRSVLEHCGGHGPLVVTVDDIHWAEPTLLDLLERLRAEVGVPFLLVCQARPELLERRPDWGDGALNATTFSLAPLTGQHTAAVLQGLLGPGLPHHVVAAVEGWADGNPLFVEEVAAHLVDTGVLRREHDGWVVVGDLTRLSVPPSVTALLAASLDRIPRPERVLLERISVMGLEFTTTDATALAAGGVDVLALLASLSRRDLIRPVPGLRAQTWAFRHVLLRDAAYEALPKSVRARLHERVADRLEESATVTGGEIHAFVGHHLEQAVRLQRELSNQGEPVAALARRAASTLAAAGARACDTDDLPASTELLQRAIALTPHSGAARRDLLWRLAQAQGRQNLIIETGHTLEEVAALMDDATPALERAIYKAWVLDLRSASAEDVDPAEIASAATAAAQLARKDQQHERLAQALWIGVSAAVMSGRWEDVARMTREIQQIATSAFDRRVARIQLVQASYFGPVPINDGLAYVATVLDQPGQTLRSSTAAQTFQAAMFAAAGRIEPALSLARETMHTARDLDPHVLAAAAEATAWIHIATGNLKEACRNYDQAIEVARNLCLLGVASGLLGWKAALLLEQGGRDDQARQVLTEAAAVTSRYDITSIALVETCHAVLAARDGDHAQAAARASKALAAIDATDEIFSQAAIRRWLSEVPRRRGDVPEQRRMLAEARDLYRAKGHVPLLAATEQLLAEVTG